jgi:hypothetical protein
MALFLFLEVLTNALPDKRTSLRVVPSESTLCARPVEVFVGLFAQVSFTRRGNTLTSGPYAHKAGTLRRATAPFKEERLEFASDD